MFTIINVIKGIKMNEQSLFGRKIRCNCKYSMLQVFQLLLVCPCFMIRNPFNIYGSPLGGKLGCHKDVFYNCHNVTVSTGASWCIFADVVLADIHILLFFVNRSKRVPWS